MEGKFKLFLILNVCCITRCAVAADLSEEDGLMAELPLKALLTQKKVLSEEDFSASVNVPKPSILGRTTSEEFRTPLRNAIRKLPSKKNFHEYEYEEDKGWITKKKGKNKIHDILNTSVTALSYLAFGGYLLCMIVGALREKRRFYPYTGTPTNPQGNTQFSQVLQQYVQRPIRIRFPAFTVNHSGRKRRKRNPVSTVNFSN